MSKPMFQHFNKVTKEQWLAQATKDLKGKPLSDLVSETLDGIKIQPFYMAEDLNNLDLNQPKKAARHWDVVQEIFVENELDANAKALDCLNKGATSLLFYLLPKVDLEILLNKILIEHIVIHFVSEGNGAEVLSKFENVIAARGLNPEEIQGSINIDGIENLARTGNWFANKTEDFNALGAMLNSGLTHIKTICVNANIYGNAGATPAQQLGMALAHAHEYLVNFGPESASKFWMNLSIGSQYFEEIAKFRAMRKLWALLLDEYKLEQSELCIYAESGMRNKTIFDSWVNMLRTTTEGMSAVLGGVNQLNLKPYNATFANPDNFGERIARNQQLLLSLESYLDRTIDAAAGAYFIEQLTQQLAKKAWAVFKEIEAQGGLIAGLESGLIQNMVEKSAAAEQDLFDNGKLNLLGTNIYPNKEEKMSDKVEYAQFYKAPKGATTVAPLQVKRLAEELEKERLASEK